MRGTVSAPAPVFAPEPPEPVAPAVEVEEEASWLDAATAAAPEPAAAPVLEPLMPPIFAPEPPAPVFEEAATAEELWSEEPEPVLEPEPIPEPEPARVKSLRPLFRRTTSSAPPSR